MTDLSLVQTTELVEELASRYEVLVLFATLQKTETVASVCQIVKGPVLTTLGATEMLRSIIHERFVTSEGQDDDKDDDDEAGM